MTLFQKFVVSLVCATTLTATVAEAQTRRASNRAAPAAPAAPVNLVRSDADLFAATLAGRFAQGISDPALAAQAWSRAYLRQPGDADVFARAISANVQAGQVAQAVSLAKAAPLSIRNDEAALTLAVDAFSQGRYSEVVRTLTGRNFAPSQRLFAEHLTAYALLAQNKSDDAINVTSRATGVPALDKAALMSRAIILSQAKRDEEAGILFQNAIEANVKFPMGVRAYGNFLVRANRKADAIALYQQLIASGGASASEFSADLAQIDVPVAARQAPQDLRSVAAAGLVTLAQGLSAQGRGGAPIGLLNLVAYLDPRSDGVALALASQLIDESQADQARPILIRFPATSPEYLAARTELVWLTFETDKPRAVALAREALQARPRDPAAIRLLADVLAANRNDREAEGLYSDLIQSSKAAGRVDSDIWPLYFGRGGARERQGNWTAALADLRLAKTAAPNQPSVLNYLGYALADRGENLDEALTMLRAAVRLRPSSANILDSLGWAQFKVGRFEEAVGTLEKAAGMEATVAEISDHLGDAYWRSGRKDEARMEWQRTLRLNPEPAVRDKIAVKLRDGLPAPQ